MFFSFIWRITFNSTQLTLGLLTKGSRMAKRNTHNHSS